MSQPPNDMTQPYHDAPPGSLLPQQPTYPYPNPTPPGGYPTPSGGYPTPPGGGYTTPPGGGYSTPPGGISYRGSGYYSTPPGGITQATPAPQQPQPRRAKLSTAVVLGVIAALLLIGTGVFVTMWISERNDRSAVLNDNADRERTLTDLNGQVSSAESEQRDAEKRRGDLQTENRALSTCVDAVKVYLEQLRASAERTAARDKVFEVCAAS